MDGEEKDDKGDKAKNFSFFSVSKYILLFLFHQRT